MLVFSLFVFLVFVAAVGPLAILALDLAAPRLHVAARTEPARGAAERSAGDIELEVRRRLYGERRETPVGWTRGERHGLNERTSTRSTPGNAVIARALGEPV